jgi:dienelactone hydrolase
MKIFNNMNMIKSVKHYKFIFSIAFLFFGTFSVSAQQENLNVLDRWIEWTGSNNMLIRHLNKQAFEYLDSRDKEIEDITGRGGWIERQQKVKDVLMETIGPFPEKTPLNARVTGIVKKDGFRIEKVIYESMPGFYVTAAMLIPDGKIQKRPAIIQVSGHGFAAFRSETNQRYIYNLARKGFIVFAIDPLGQGERIQYWDDEIKGSKVGTSPVDEHSYFGNQMFFTGISPVRYFTWDGIRGVDYLLTRNEVDSDRIGIFGCSGGGTQAVFIAAFDERIKALAPGCYITGFRRLLESIGLQDAEQNIYKGIKRGITHADLLQVRAPRPLLISSTTRDYFSIQGAIETYQEVLETYRAFDKEENISHVTDDAGHGFHNTITDVYAFFQRVFEVPGSPAAEAFEGFKTEDLQVSATGQLASSVGGNTAFDINKKESEKLIQKITESRTSSGEHLTRVTARAKELSGYIEPGEEIKTVFRGRYQRDGYAVEMYALHGEGDYVVPLLLFVPGTGNNHPAIIYMHPEGKITDAAPGGKIEQLVRKGYIVAAPDVIGVGEVKDDNFLYEFAAQYLSMMIGRSITGIQAGDVTRVVNFLRSRPDVERGNIGALAFDEMCPVLLHAAAFNSSIGPVTLVGSLISYGSVVSNKFYDQGFSANWVTGAITAYDLPDLMGCVAPRKLALVGLKDHMKEPASKGLMDKELSFPLAVFSQKNVKGNINIFPSSQETGSVIDWSFGK